MPARQPDDDAHERLAAQLLELQKAGELVGWLARLPGPARAVAERALARLTERGWRASPLAMGEHFGELEPLAHTQLLSTKFVDAVNGRDPFQIWSLPPQHGKSLIASRYGPAWALDRDPGLQIGLTSYGDFLASENATACRNILLTHADELQVRLPRVGRADRFRTEQGGGITAAGVGAGLTGFKLHGAVVDDPFKNWQEAHSEARREQIWNWFRSVLLTRLNARQGRPGWVIVVMTRWHEDDLSGRLQAQDDKGEGLGWTVLRLPAIAEDDDDPLGRHRGEALAPALHPIEELEQWQRTVGSYLFAGLYQQRPAPEEGGEIKRGWWRWDAAFPPRYDDALTSWDMKMKDKETGNFVSGQAWGRTGSDVWLIDSMRGQYNLVLTKTAIVLMQVRHPWIGRHLIENTGNGPEVMAALRQPQPGYRIDPEHASQLGMTDDEIPRCEALFARGMPGLVPETPKGDKRARARAATPPLEAGNVHLPEGRDFALALVNECAAFPNGAYDDQVDAWSQAMKRLTRSGASVAEKPAVTVERPDPAASAKIGPSARIGRYHLR
jgi:hypothetical protein